ncbi:hypothetical protein Acr_20g0005730 [Actinidia rufa]|uniref:Transmembrane protein n=1 Tax=Actinidia rufa TaxID=165716 RepID=A0A7J0GD64_9ERIC|nr:hypothetical protein Acr_20g0005730 [Actinidia rufa]
MRVVSVALTLVVLVLLHVHVQPCKASSRTLKREYINLESLEKGPVPPSGPSGCTNIPGMGGPTCPSVQGMNYAGEALPRARAYPRLMVPFGVATINQN